jgi:hypothetical protein
MMERVPLTLLHALLLLATVQIAGRSEAAEFTEWMTGSAYQAMFDAKSRDGFYPVQVEARIAAQGLLYRAQFEPFPDSPFSYYSHFGMEDRSFKKRNGELESQGYRLIWIQHVEDNRRVRRYQATWVKGNGPAGFESLAQGVGSAPAGIPAVPARPTPPAPVPATGATSRGEFTFKVTYRVKGTAAGVMLTFRDPQRGTVQSTARLPWEVSFDAGGGAFLYVSAQNQGVDGSVSCEIEMDGESRTVSTSTGAYVITECSNMAERR